MHLKEIRAQLNWSFSEMADSLGISKATYQSYDEGKRATPPEILKSALEQLQRANSHSEQLKYRYRPGGEVDQELDRKYPFGIISEATA